MILKSNLSTLNHALLVEHKKIPAAVQHRAALYCQVGEATVLLLLQKQRFLLDFRNILFESVAKLDLLTLPTPPP